MPSSFFIFDIHSTVTFGNEIHICYINGFILLNDFLLRYCKACSKFANKELQKVVFLHILLHQKLLKPSILFHFYSLLLRFLIFLDIIIFVISIFSKNDDFEFLVPSFLLFLFLNIQLFIQLFDDHIVFEIGLKDLHLYFDFQTWCNLIKEFIIFFLHISCALRLLQVFMYSFN